ncbi:MAG: class II aldolase/adducin family protein [Thermodesulfobacteriota bacterium]|nr:class II aldolase/adducin family protein [Thermodesulfobacteriota bacterium]
MLKLTRRRDLIAIARSMNEIGLNQGASGNVSVRHGDAILITPSGLSYERCTPEDMVRLAMDGTAEGIRKPSSEWHLHLDIYETRPEAGAVLHAHSPWCTTLACLDREIPPFHYMVAMAGGDTIRCAPYAQFGSKELSNNVTAALKRRTACLMSHHGMVCYAENLEKVLDLAIEVENLARVYCQALQLGKPSLLDGDQMNEVLAKFADYRSCS